MTPLATKPTEQPGDRGRRPIVWLSGFFLPTEVLTLDLLASQFLGFESHLPFYVFPLLFVPALVACGVTVAFNRSSVLFKLGLVLLTLLGLIIQFVLDLLVFGTIGLVLYGLEGTQ